MNHQCVIQELSRLFFFRYESLKELIILHVAQFCYPLILLSNVRKLSKSFMHCSTPGTDLVTRPNRALTICTGMVNTAKQSEIFQNDKL